MIEIEPMTSEGDWHDVAEALWLDVWVLEKPIVLRLLRTASPDPVPDRLLTVKEAAAILHYTADKLYRHADKFPFTVREGRLVRFSSQGIQTYIRARRRAG